MAFVASDPEGDLFFSERQRPKYDIVGSKGQVLKSLFSCRVNGSVLKR